MGCDLVHGLFAEVNDIGIFGQKEDALKEMRHYISEGLEDHLEYVLESEAQAADRSLEELKTSTTEKIRDILLWRDQ